MGPTTALVCDIACASGPEPAAMPSDTAMFTGPEPVKYTEIVLPALAGFASVLSDSSEFSAAARPFASKKIPGAVAETVALSELAGKPFTLTTISALPVEVSHGTWKFTWLGVAARIGAGRPFTMIDTPLKFMGSGALAVINAGAKPEP